jgi:hypothetical protein
VSLLPLLLAPHRRLQQQHTQALLSASWQQRPPPPPLPPPLWGAPQAAPPPPHTPHLAAALAALCRPLLALWQPVVLLVPGRLQSAAAQGHPAAPSLQRPASAC